MDLLDEYKGLFEDGLSLEEMREQLHKITQAIAALRARETQLNVRIRGLCPHTKVYLTRENTYDADLMLYVLECDDCGGVLAEGKRHDIDAYLKAHPLFTSNGPPIMGV